MTGRMVEINAESGFSGYLAGNADGGPALVLLQEIFGVNDIMRAAADYFAEEGYTVLVPDLFWRIQPGIELGYSDAEFQQAIAYMGQFDVDQGIEDIGAAVAYLQALPGAAGHAAPAVLGFCLGGKLAYLTAARKSVSAAISFYGVGIEDMLGESEAISCPVILHFAGADRFVPAEAVARIQAHFAGNADVSIYEYPGVDHGFFNPGRPAYNRPSAMMAHSRSIALLRKVLGPQYDLEALWEKHCEYEFATRDVDATMATMVAEPYVNHVPTMTGGVGYKELYRFYKHHFIPGNPEDTQLVPISRTVGADRIVDEMLFCFTHTVEIDWMLPGIEPTGKYVEIPLIAVVNFRGDKLYHEHIYWDQASVLAQIGVLNTEGLPVTGRETARKLVDESLPSNGLMRRWPESANKD